MISLILPYWDRQEAADKALFTIWKQYSKLSKDGELEVIVVDDGNEVPFVWPTCAEFLDRRIVRLPKKSKPTPQSKAWNAGVKAAKGDIICLSCIEILHETPVLEAMKERLTDNNYVLASAWCPEEEAWHCHSTVHSPYVPDGTGGAFCGMMKRKNFPLFDEEYHNGCGYEDKDFIHRVLKKGLSFILADDLKVIHPKTAATCQWTSEGFDRNKALFLTKWPDVANKFVTFVCLKAGKGYSAEYVNILHDMVLRNTALDIIGRFVCITDDAEGLDAGIEVMPLPAGLETWWGKLYMFKRNLFPDGTRMVFMDLDTVITGRLDDILAYRGQFATLRKFAGSKMLAPAIILWEAGEYTSHIWNEWVLMDKPRNDYGDLWWLNSLNEGKFSHQVDSLQKLFPRKFVSYKYDCQVSPPLGAAVVCFHGVPMPHQAKGWVDNFWRKAGYSSAQYDVVCNTQLGTVVDNIKYSSGLGLKSLQVKPETKRRAILVGGGASLKGDIERIKDECEKGSFIIAMNGSGDFLNYHLICPDLMVIIDSRAENKRFVDTCISKNYFIASQASPDVFNAIEARKTTIFHIDIPHIGEYVLNDGQPLQAIGGGSTVGLIAMSLAYTQGFRDIHLYGYDSSFEDGEGHAYEQEHKDEVIDVYIHDRNFPSTPWMITQINQFQPLANQLRALDCDIVVHGKGALPYLAWVMTNTTVDQEPITEKEKYDKIWEFDEYRLSSPGEKVAELAAEMFGITEDDTVIEFGCGTGRGGKAIHDITGCKVTQIDIAEKCRDEGIDLPFMLKDMSKPIGLRAKYGFCTDVMEHIPTDQVDAVINNIMACVDSCFFQISLTYDDWGMLIGHQLHLTVHPVEWWAAVFSRLGYDIASSVSENHLAIFNITKKQRKLERIELVNHLT